MPKLYNYDPTTGAFLTESVARLDPIDNEPMVPANATLLEPPQSGVKQVAAWSDVDEDWTLKPDFRGAEYWLADGTHHTILKIGEELPSDALDVPPPPPFDEMKAQALHEAKTTAINVRQQISGAVDTVRIAGWMLKGMFGAVWQANDAAPNPLLQTMADVAATGFGIETEMTGETSTDLRDRSVEKAGEFFIALQLVEGMERMAETMIETTETPEALVQTIAQLRAMETQALTTLAALQGA